MVVLIVLCLGDLKFLVLLAPYVRYHIVTQFCVEI